MKVTMQLTLDGLLKALKTRAHDLADEIETETRLRDVERRREAAPGRTEATP